MTNERENEPDPPTQQDSGSGGQQTETQERLSGREPGWGERGQDKIPEREHKQERTQKQ